MLEDQRPRREQARHPAGHGQTQHVQPRCPGTGPARHPGTDPGQLDEADGFLVWQPYQGVELYGGDYAKKRTGDDYIWHAEQQIIPKGMARTVRSVPLLPRS